MVAFVRQLPGMTAEQYRTRIARALESHDAMMQKMSGEADGHDEHMHRRH